MEIGKKRITKKSGSIINLYFLGDIHEGNCNCNKHALRKAVEIIKNDKDGYWVGMGDYIEAITHGSDIRFDPISIAKEYSIRDLKDLPRKQAINVYKILEPIDDKCLALMVGNHEESYIKYNKSDIYDIFHSMFKSNPAKLGYVGFFLLLVKTRATISLPLTIALNHGVGGGGYREGYPINLVHDVFKYIYADINVMGHIHTLNEDSKKIITISNRGNLIKANRLWGTSGCFLNTYEIGNTNYFESRAGRKGESDIGMLKAEIKVNSDYLSSKLVKMYLDG